MVRTLLWRPPGRNMIVISFQLPANILPILLTAIAQLRYATFMDPDRHLCLNDDERMPFLDDTCEAVMRACPAEALCMVRRSIEQSSLRTWLFPWPFFGDLTLLEMHSKISFRTMTIAECFDVTSSRKRYASKTSSLPS